MWYVYILQSNDRRLYTGITNNLARRLEQHKSGVGSKFTRAFGVKKLVYSEKLTNKSAALRREIEIKRWQRSKKLMLIKGEL